MMHWILCGVGVVAVLAALFYGIYVFIDYSTKEQDEEGENEL